MVSTGLLPRPQPDLSGHFLCSAAGPECGEGHRKKHRDPSPPSHHAGPDGAGQGDRKRLHLGKDLGLEAS